MVRTEPANGTAPPAGGGCAAPAGQGAALAVLRGLAAGWLASFGTVAAVAARRELTGLSIARWTDAAPPLLLGFAGACIAHRLAAGARAGAGLATSLALGAAAASAIGGAAAGAQTVLGPLALACGLALGLLGGPSRSRLGAAAQALGAAAGAVAAGSAALRMVDALGAAPTLALFGGQVLAVAAGAAGARPGPAPGGWARPVLGASMVACAGFLAPRSLWPGVPSAAGLLFLASVGAALAAGRARSPLLAPLCLLPALLVRAWDGHPPVDPARERHLAQCGAARAVYLRGTQELQLWSAGALVGGEGPDRPQAELVATLLRALLAPGDRVLLLGAFTGRLPRALGADPAPCLDVVDFRPDAAELLAHLGGAGPVPAPDGTAAAPAPARVRGALAALRALPAGSRQAIVVGEPLHARAAWQTTAAAQAELRRVAGPGLVVQPFARDRVPAAALARLFGAAAAVFPWNSVLVVGDVALLLSAAAPVRWPGPDAFAAWSEAARWTAHAAHLGGAADLHLALRGTVASPEGGDTGAAAEGTREGGDPAADVLRAWLVPLQPAPEPAPDSVLRHWEQSRCRLLDARRELAGLCGADQGAAQAIAVPFLPVGAPAAVLQAALGLADAQGVRLRSAEAASLAAHAIDPTFFAGPRPPVLAPLPVPVDPTGPLEDLAALPPPERLAVACAGGSPRAVALRARFPSPCARALVGALAAGPLAPEAAAGLRELADPFVLAAAGRALAARGALPELLAFWRGDLPMPAALRELWDCGGACRVQLVDALGGRRDGPAVELLAEALMDPAPAVRQSAAASLQATAGGKVAYDPAWPASRRLDAARRLRALHNRTP